MATRLIRRFLRWLSALFEEPNAPVYPVRPQETPPEMDWFAWECEQYARYPAFWFNPWRYADTPLAFDEPTQEQRRAVWNASKARAVRRYGELMCEMHAAKLNEIVLGTPHPERLLRQPDPWAWIMSQEVH